MSVFRHLMVKAIGKGSMKKSLTDLDNLPDPDILANEIIENIESGLSSFKEIMESIGESE